MLFLGLGGTLHRQAPTNLPALNQTSHDYRMTTPPGELAIPGKAVNIQEAPRTNQLGIHQSGIQHPSHRLKYTSAAASRNQTREAKNQALDE